LSLTCCHQRLEHPPCSLCSRMQPGRRGGRKSVRIVCVCEIASLASPLRRHPWARGPAPALRDALLPVATALPSLRRFEAVAADRLPALAAALPGARPDVGPQTHTYTVVEGIRKTRV